MSNQQNMSARDFVDARDIRKSILYRKDGYMIGYLRIFSFNLDLKNEEAKAVIAEHLTASFKDDRKDFVYFTLPREIDLDNYKDNLKKRHQNTDDLGKRHILTNMILEGTRLSTSGENYEHQHFIKIWGKGKDEAHTEEMIMTRLKEFKARFAAVEIETHILNETDLIKLCNLFGNSLQASFENTEQNAFCKTIMQLP